MTPSEATLLRRIQDFSIDGDTSPALPFALRLARENGWTLEHAQRVVREYKRFVFLAMTAGHPVTPSDAVDQAWHLHLTYTRSYWERFCGGVLPRALHHQPTRGGAREDAKFKDWYGRTLSSYERMFGEAPPGDIWPAAAERFGQTARWTRIDAREHWIVSKRGTRRAGVVAMIFAVACVSLGAAAISGFSQFLVAAFVFFIFMCVVAAIVKAVVNPGAGGRRRSGDSGGGCGGGHSEIHGGCGADAGADATSGDAGGCGSSGCGGGGCGGGGD